MGLIFDSSIWVALASGDLEHEEIIAAAGDARVFASTISLGELRFGVEICEDPAQRALRAAFLRQIETRPVLDLTRHTAAAFGILAAAVKRTGRPPRPRYNDLWIAAQAIEHGYAVLTRNVRDFADLPGLQVIAI